MKSITTLFRMWIAAWIILTPLLTGVHAQEFAGSDPTTINRVTELAYIQDMRNDHNPNLLLLLYAPRIRMYHPFDPMGAIETAEQNARDEMSFQKASTYRFGAHRSHLAVNLVTNTGAFVDDTFGTLTGEAEHGGPNVGIHRLEEGHICEGNTMWNQQMLLQEMQLIPLEYQPYSLEPWVVTLGTTSSTPEQHHAVLSIFFDSLCSNCTIDTGAIYAENIVVH